MRTPILITTANTTGDQFNVSGVYLVNAVDMNTATACLLPDAYVGYVGRGQNKLWGYTEQLEDFTTAEFTYETPNDAAAALLESQANVVVY